MVQISNQQRSNNKLVKLKRSAYWVSTVVISLVFLNGGINDILRQDPYYAMLLKLGYPGYVSVLLGIWKVLGVVALLIPGMKTVKEWAYAGFFFLLTGAVVSHLQIGDMVIFQLIILLLLALSWQLRPANRRVGAL